MDTGSLNNSLVNPKASFGHMKDPKSSAKSPRLFSMYGFFEVEDEDEEDVCWKLRSDR